MPKGFRDQICPTLTSTGTANAQVLTYAVAPAALNAGDMFRFYAGFPIPGHDTSRSNALLGAKNILFNGGALAGREIASGQVSEIVYGGTNFQLSQSAATPGHGYTAGTGLTLSAFSFRRPTLSRSSVAAPGQPL